MDRAQITPRGPVNTASRTLPFGPRAIAEAAVLIADGDIVAVPTETVYGLAADATSAAAVARIYAAKGRPSFNPLIVHVADLAAAQAIGVFDEEALDLAARHWPGPLTLVLPLRPESEIARIVTAGLDTVAVRVSAHRAMRALLVATESPLAAPSANASNGISPTRAEHVRRSLGDRVGLIIDDGATEAGLESTIVMGRRILRPGPISREILFPGGDESESNLPTGILVPGQLATHYAPAKPLRLNVTTAEADEFLIGFGQVTGDFTLSATGNPVEAAAMLFDALHRADASSSSRIAVAPMPAAGIGEAINDRLTRAACR